MNISFNFSFFILMFLLIKFNILLLNEESLILAVFCVFCVLSTIKLGPEISHSFETQRNSIKSNLVQSSSKILSLFNSQKVTLTASQNWLNEFTKLKIHFLTFNSLIFKQSPEFYQSQILIRLQKKLMFSKRLEQQVIKLISLIILEHTKKNLRIKRFCIKVLLLKKVRTSEKIYLREHLTKI